MIDERQQELAALHAFDLLEGAEKTAFEAALASSPELRALVDELRHAATSLAFTAPAANPSAALKARVLASLPAAPVIPFPSAPSASITPPAAARRSFLQTFPWILAASLALGCGWLGQLYLTTRAQSSLLRNQQALADVELRSLRQHLEAERLLAQRQIGDAGAQLAERDRQIAALGQRVDALTGASAEANRAFTQLRDQLASADSEIKDLRDRLRSEVDLAQFKIATLASLAGNTPEALAVAVWNPATQEGVLRVSKLPALASDKDYQLWVIDPAYPIPVDGGVFTVDPASGDARVIFHPNKPVKNAAKFAISLERKGGVPKAEGPILLLGD